MSRDDLERQPPEPQWKRDLDEFYEELRRRLAKGERDYGNASFSAAPLRLGGELAEEALDIAGWGFILWQRIRRLNASLADMGDPTS